MSIRNGSYYPNVKGATSWRTARPLYVGNDRVSVQVYDWEGAQRIAIHVGCKMPFESVMPAEVTDYDAFYAFIHATVEAYAAELAKPEPVKVEKPKGRDYSGFTATEVANLKGARYLAAFVDSGYGMPYDDREHELIGSIEHAKRELWTRAVRNEGRSRYIDTSLDSSGFSFFPCVTDDAEIVLYSFKVANGEIQRSEEPACRVFMGPRGGIRVERY